MRAGYCDLDILLDSFFLHFPSQIEVHSWYPGPGCKRKNIPNLISALLPLDAAELWRTQYRSSIADYPGSSIPRLPGKFFHALSLGFGLHSFIIQHDLHQSFILFFIL